MCGRYTLYSDPLLVMREFNLAKPPVLQASYNIAPSQIVPVVCEIIAGGRVLTSMRWGLIPFWTKPNEKPAAHMINARLDTIDEKPAFKKAFQQHRCLIIADGFYEWKSIGKIKKPFYFYRKDKLPFAFAGIWSRWVGSKETIDSCAIITGEPNKIVSSIHDRMPIILNRDAYSDWLDPEMKNQGRLKNILLENKIDNLAAHAVTPAVNNPRFNQAECIQVFEGDDNKSL
jgi:putative SOS response-associated peptidase YedK